jgi:hypothetical protein
MKCVPYNHAFESGRAKLRRAAQRGRYSIYISIVIKLTADAHTAQMG